MDLTLLIICAIFGVFVLLNIVGTLGVSESVPGINYIWLLDSVSVADWMVQRGARKLLLNSRSKITNGYQKLCLRRWEKDGVKVETSTTDLSDKMVAELFIRELVTKGEIIGGIFNAALNLCDENFPKQTIANFQQVSKPKDCLTKTLDEISRQLCSELDYFVAFSSISSGRGNAAQSNYGWANSAMERICERRMDDGLHGLAIQWGQVGQVGYVAEKLKKENAIELHGTEAQSLRSCLEVLDVALQQPFPVVSSSALAAKGKKNEERKGLLFRIEKLFGIADFKAVPTEKKLSELGLDSLIKTELNKILERDHQTSLPRECLQFLTVADILAIDAGTFDVQVLTTKS